MAELTHHRAATLTGDMITGYYYKEPAINCSGLTSPTKHYITYTISGLWGETIRHHAEIDPKTLSTGSGLQDVNQQEIFSHDRIHVVDSNSNIVQGVVEIHKGNFIVRNLYRQEEHILLSNFLEMYPNATIIPITIENKPESKVWEGISCHQ